jgi:hypothetical protein
MMLDNMLGLKRGYQKRVFLLQGVDPVQSPYELESTLIRLVQEKWHLEDVIHRPKLKGERK